MAETRNFSKRLSVDISRNLRHIHGKSFRPGTNGFRVIAFWSSPWDAMRSVAKKLPEKCTTFAKKLAGSYGTFSEKFPGKYAALAKKLLEKYVTFAKKLPRKYESFAKKFPVKYATFCKKLPGKFNTSIILQRLIMCLSFLYVYLTHTIW